MIPNGEGLHYLVVKKNTKILEFNQYQKSDKTPFINYADVQSLMEKIDGCRNNPEKHLQET